MLKFPALLFFSFAFLRGRKRCSRDQREETMIQVKCGCGGGDCREWAILELQGVVEAQSSIADRLQGLEIGRLCHTSSPGSYTFTVGYHELSGKKIALKKPLLVMQKKRFSNPDAPDSSTAELEIIGIIRHKILFDTRPKALISKPQAKEKKIGANI